MKFSDAIVGGIVLAAISLATVAGAQTPPPAADPAPSAATSPQATALGWLDQYRARQALFNDKDLERLRNDLATGNDQDAQVWLDRTAQVRQILDDPKWQETERWFRDFLRVQAIYSDEQIAELRSDAKTAAKESPQDLIGILANIEASRSRLRTGSQNATQLRQQQVELTQAFQQQAFQQREAARLNRERAQPPTLPQPPVIRPEPVVRPPLVDSLDYARWSIMRNFWRPVVRVR